jgi:hypothetical protein
MRDGGGASVGISVKDAISFSFDRLDGNSVTSELQPRLRHDCQLRCPGTGFNRSRLKHRK